MSNDVQTPPADEAAAKRLAEIRERGGDATPGPWYAHNPDDAYSMSVYCVSDSPEEPDTFSGNMEEVGKGIIAYTLLQTPRVVGHRGNGWEEDANFIAHARDDIPWLLDRLAAAERERDAAVPIRHLPLEVKNPYHHVTETLRHFAFQEGVDATLAAIAQGGDLAPEAGNAVDLAAGASAALGEGADETSAAHHIAQGRAIPAPRDLAGKRCPTCGEPATHVMPLIREGGRRELWCSNAHAWLSGPTDAAPSPAGVAPDRMTDVEQIKAALSRECELRPSEVKMLLDYVARLESAAAPDSGGLALAIARALDDSSYLDATYPMTDIELEPIVKVIETALAAFAPSPAAAALAAAAPAKAASTTNYHYLYAASILTTIPGPESACFEHAILVFRAVTYDAAVTKAHKDAELKWPPSLNGFSKPHVVVHCIDTIAPAKASQLQKCKCGGDIFPFVAQTATHGSCSICGKVSELTPPRPAPADAKGAER